MPRLSPYPTLLASLLALAGCGLERLKAEFHMTDPTAATTAGTSETSEGSSSSADSSSSGSGESGSGSTSSGSTGSGESTSSGESTLDHETGKTSEAGATATSPPTVCGDGLVEGDEECDDADDDDLDECSNDCARAWTIFVTSESMWSGKINGLYGADTRCRNRAGNGGLPRHLSYKALLSDSTTDAADRLHRARGWYRLVNGLPVARGWQALVVEPQLINPVNVDEFSQTSESDVWTGTLPGGFAVPDAEHCADWTSDSLLKKGHYGKSAKTDAGWLFWPNEVTNPTACNPHSALYCIEQP